MPISNDIFNLRKFIRFTPQANVRIMYFIKHKPSPHYTQ